SSVTYLDFAHAPSKVKATLQAFRDQFPNRRLTVCLELHTFSSLNKNFLSQYKDTLLGADFPMVYFNPHTIEHKRLPQISIDEVKTGFGQQNLQVYTNSEELLAKLNGFSWEKKNLLIMTSGNFSGVNLQDLAEKIVGKK
ncbi:MAG TPA: peptidoglycan synthetase, partial [Tenuifilaceae bacterium]|nr:peptidoglycan synthetase [Tenuifilaceae bacterium]